MGNKKKSRAKAMEIAATAFGVESVALTGEEKDQIEVTGEGIDTVELAKLLRKKIGCADVVSVGPAAAAAAAAAKENEATPCVVPLVWESQPYYYNSYPVVYTHHYRDDQYNSNCSIM